MIMRFGVTALLLAAAAIPARAAGIDFGSPGTGAMCAPMICTLRYQQVLDSSIFANPISITDIRFSNLRLPGSLGTNDFTIILSTARRGVGSVTEDFNGNAGLDAQTFFSGSFSGPSAPTFTITGNPFAYNPGAGDLLLEIRRNTAVANTTGLYLDAHFDNIAGSDIVFTYNPDFFTGVQRSSGLALGFNTAPGAGPGGVPEPAAWAMLIAGFGMAGSAMRLRRKSDAIPV